MRYSPDLESNFDREELVRLNAESWMIDLLRANPAYVSWGPHEDYMAGKSEGWTAPIIYKTWGAVDLSLDDLNEVVNFYFAVERSAKDCPTCDGNGYHPAAQEIVNTFYAHMNPRGEHWNDKITEDEVAALVEAGRAPAGSTVAEINAQNRPGARGFGHDAINRGILTRTRLQRHGLPVKCPTCDGHGSVFTEPGAHVSLVLWLLHPRKGASRGVEVERVQRSDLPAIRAFLEQAAERNAERFSRLGTLG